MQIRLSFSKERIKGRSFFGRKKGQAKGKYEALRIPKKD
jgi:hypothetical protein